MERKLKRKDTEGPKETIYLLGGLFLSKGQLGGKRDTSISGFFLSDRPYFMESGAWGRKWGEDIMPVFERTIRRPVSQFFSVLAQEENKGGEKRLSEAILQGLDNTVKDLSKTCSEEG